MNITRDALAELIDHTLLKPEAACADIRRLCEEAVEYGFKTVCLNPCYVSLACRELAGASPGVCAVIGFPLGAGTTAVKAAEAAEAVYLGADEVDVVMNVGFLKSGMTEETKEDLQKVIEAVRQVKAEAVVKVILETCLLTDGEKRLACRLAVEAGGDFVKTSTGFNLSGAQAADIKLMREAVGPGIGIKAAGGIRTLATALAMLEAGADRIGASAGVSILNELR